jgi:hypothetical protein
MNWGHRHKQRRPKVIDIQTNVNENTGDGQIKQNQPK